MATKTSEANRQGLQYETPSQGAGLPFHGAIIFNSADDMLAALLGAPQHDAHVGTRRLSAQLDARKERDDRAFEALMAYVRTKLANERAAQ